MALEQDSWDPRDTWEPVDLRGAIDMAESPYPEFDLDEPGTLFRADGVGLLYEERVNGFHGEPESGQSWLAQVAAAEVLRAGKWVHCIDFDGLPRDHVGHLLALGVPAEAVRSHYRYWRPEVAMTDAGALEDRMDSSELTIIDGLTRGMALYDLSANDNGHVLKFWELVVRPVQRGTWGPTPLVIDHVAKDRASAADGP